MTDNPDTDTGTNTVTEVDVLLTFVTLVADLVNDLGSILQIPMTFEDPFALTKRIREVATLAAGDSPYMWPLLDGVADFIEELILVDLDQLADEKKGTK